MAADGATQSRLAWDRVYRAEVHVATHDPLDVRHFVITERMSSLFEVRVVAVSRNPDIDFEGVIGQAMTFVAHGPDVRTWAGVCCHLRQVRVEDQHLSTYELTLVPRLWLLGQRRNHRMFQHLTELDIVQKILGEWGITPTLRLTGQYRKRKYRLQYGESDYAFICRMLEDAGVSFYFDNSGESGLVLDDGPQGNEARPPIAFRDRPTDNAELEHVTEVHVGRHLRPGKYTVRDHDYRRPPAYKLMAGSTGGEAVEGKLERYHYVPGAFLYESQKGEDTPNADDQGKYRADEQEAEALVQRRLEAERTSVREVTFKTNTLDLAPGTVLSFLDHPKSELGPKKRLLVVESRFQGEIPGQWVHACTAYSADQPYRPDLVTPRPRAQGVESATVVGPAGEEIHVDEFGRVRVQFHWDREGRYDEHSSCWIHVSQPWGGSGFGGTNLPRIGQEVIVDFLGGDPDRPVITGRVYTNLTKTPYSLPANKTQSGWKSNSSPTTGGYNEMMFEDKAGSELVRFQAEKDHHELVKNDRASTIGNDRTTNIGNDESQTVGNNLMQQVMSNLGEMVGANRSRGVGNDEKVQIGRDYGRQVGNDEKVQIGRNQTIKVGKKITIECGKSSLVMDKDGNITLQGVKILIDGSTHVQVRGGTIDDN
jgi:type VI secretion system secreted protein VgrG